MLTKRRVLVAAWVVSLAGLGASVLEAKPGVLLPPDELEFISGGTGAGCDSETWSKHCVDSSSCAGAQAPCDADCASSCTGPGDDTLCRSGTTYETCNVSSDEDGCGEFVEGLTCGATAGVQPCGCLGQSTLTGRTCWKNSATVNGCE